MDQVGVSRGRRKFKAQITVVWKQKLSQQILSLKKLPEERDFCNILKNVSTVQELVPLSLILDRKDGQFYDKRIPQNITQITLNVYLRHHNIHLFLMNWNLIMTSNLQIGYVIVRFKTQLFVVIVHVRQKHVKATGKYRNTPFLFLPSQ